MFEVQGAKPGQPGMRQVGWEYDGNSYKDTKPCNIPSGCYTEVTERCPPCEIREGPNGRGVYCKPELPNEYIPRPGAVMMRITPPISAISTRYLPTHCSACHAEQNPQMLKRCQKCRVVHYCGQECQKYDWHVHKFECPALVAHAERRAANPESQEEGSAGGRHDDIFAPSETIRALGRMLWIRFREKPRSALRKEFELLQSHREKLTPSSPQTAMYTRLGHALAAYVSLGAPDPVKMSELGIGSAKDIVDVLSKFSSNAHALSSPSLTPIGVTLSPVAALINHSCVPNCVVVFPKGSPSRRSNELDVIALGGINPGDELLLSYVDTTLPREYRQSILKERYFFECKCPNCSAGLKAAPGAFVDGRRALRCGTRNCEGFLPMPSLEEPMPPTTKAKCIQCGSECVIEPPAISDAIRVGEEGLEKAEALQFDHPDQAFKYTSNLLPLVSRFFHVGSHPVLALARVHLALLIGKLQSDRSLLDQTIRAAARVAAGVSALHMPGHPVRGVAYAEFGKLLAADEYYPEDVEPPVPTQSQVDPRANLFLVAGDNEPLLKGFDRLRMAHHSLLRAREELRIGFGSIHDGGDVGKEVTELAKRIETEVEIWRRAGGGRRPGAAGR